MLMFLTGAICGMGVSALLLEFRSYRLQSSARTIINTQRETIDQLEREAEERAQLILPFDHDHDGRPGGSVKGRMLL